MRIPYIVSNSSKSLLDFATDWFAALRVCVRAAFASPILDENAVTDAEQQIDPDFKGWVRGDPMVTGNPASRYGEDAPGYMTKNGLGILEIGAADD